MDMNTREIRLVTINEDYSGCILCITNLDNEALKNLIIQMYNDTEEGFIRPASDIVEYWIDLEMLPRNAFIKELTDTGKSDYIELKDLNTKCLAFYGFLTVNVVRGDE